jgi:hypothetical protein
MPLFDNPSCAAVRIDGRSATLARMHPDGTVSLCSMTRGPDAETPYLARVARAVGDHERVEVIGPDALRLALEREYVAIYRRPDHLRDVESPAVIDESALVERVHRLAR